MKMSFYGAFDYTFSLSYFKYDSLSSMTCTGDFVDDPNKRRRIRTLRRVRLMIVREIIDTDIDMEGDDTKYTMNRI